MKIAILRRNGLGDLICTQPLINYLKLKYPSSEIHLFIDFNNEELTKYLCPNIITHIIPKGNKYISLLTTALKQRKEKFDIAISAKTSPMKLNNLFLWAVNARKRYAVTSHKKWHEKLINTSTDLKKIDGLHQSLKLLKIFDPTIESIPSDLFPKIVMKDFFGFSNSKFPKILFSVSNNRTRSQIKNERMASIANEIIKNFPDAVFLISTLYKDREKANQLLTMIEGKSQIIESENLKSFLSLINSVDLVIVGDGGICHLAAAINKKIVALYGVTKPQNWGPLISDELCITLYDKENVNNISLQEIYLSALKLLSLK
ncbi:MULTISPECIES: glycosyltransferase family 9 protein [Photorhabdus]|uniref:Heptosyl III transferase n=2 Tax=Photorhabdus asymbiotica TaxID=291112 RepID=C7BJI4_PHOAA|nr:glycosyltransferase family 9 protein [Photorhabdus asymbiotica]RKS59369.1 ADP-heptose:LPS heptosyltransferase [Photorhabdus asymbiotica]CAQ85509.1 putative heptosyl III transferase [Photorhabdus asymbiotica]